MTSETPRLDIYWSFRSPYSYLATARLIEIARDYQLDVEFRPVRPLALREPDFFSAGRKQFLPYLFQDAPREAARLGLPFAAPNPDPVKMDMMSGKVDADQPIMSRLMALGVAAEAAGAGLAFAAAIAGDIWSGKPGWEAEENLAAAAERAGLSLAELDKWAGDHGGEIEDAIARNEAAQLEHHWGVPLMVLNGEAFFGQDRIDALIWRLDEIGAAKR